MSREWVALDMRPGPLGAVGASWEYRARCLACGYLGRVRALPERAMEDLEAHVDWDCVPADLLRYVEEQQQPQRTSARLTVLEGGRS